MSVSIKSQVVIIKSESDASAKADIARVALKKQHGRKSHESVRALLLPVFADVWSIKLVAGEALYTKGLLRTLPEKRVWLALSKLRGFPIA